MQTESNSDLNTALAEPATSNLHPVTLDSPPAQAALALMAPPALAVAEVGTSDLPSPISHLPAPSPAGHHRRHGRVARLPQLQHEMVNRMLWNGIPYKNIVAALDDIGFALSEKNISNWAVGGYLEWRLEQEAVLDNRLNQEHLLGFLRRDDAPELPEVGLQAAATRLSQVLIAKLERTDNPEANLENYSRMIELLCRLNRELSAAQQTRDAARRSLGREYDPARVKDVEQVNAIHMERCYSDPDPESELPKPAVPPLLPEVPTATFLAEQASEVRHDREMALAKHTQALMHAFLKKETPPPSDASRKVSEGIGR